MAVADPPFRHRRLSAARRVDAAAGPRSQRARGSRRARPRQSCPRRRSSRSACSPGDDASCLNLYEPRHPRILGVARFLAAGRFAFQGSLASHRRATRQPLALLLERQPRPRLGPVPVDRGRELDDLCAPQDDRRRHRRWRAAALPIRLRLVAALRRQYLPERAPDVGRQLPCGVFPEQEGYRLPAGRLRRRPAPTTSARPSRTAGDLGADAMSTAASPGGVPPRREHLSLHVPDARRARAAAGYGRPRRDPAAQRARAPPRAGAARAVGYGRRHLLMIVAPNALLLVGGLVAGAVCAGLAVAPAVVERGGRLPLTSGGALLLFAVFVTGLLSSVVATRVAISGPLLASLRSE